MYSYLSIALGGAIGAMTRYWLSGLAEKYNSSDFPLGTLSVNIIGSFLIGVLFIVFTEKIVFDKFKSPRELSPTLSKFCAVYAQV